MIVLDIQDFDAILGMDWLSKHCAFIDCKDKKVIFEIPGKEVFVFLGERSRTSTLISAAQVCSLIREECQAYLISVQDVDNKEGLQIRDIPVISEYPEIFLEDLPGLPPSRELDFGIELAPGTQPISKAPYRMALVEFKELKEQL